MVSEFFYKPDKDASIAKHSMYLSKVSSKLLALNPVQVFSRTLRAQKTLNACTHRERNTGQVHSPVIPSWFWFAFLYLKHASEIKQIFFYIIKCLFTYLHVDILPLGTKRIRYFLKSCHHHLNSV